MKKKEKMKKKVIIRINNLPLFNVKMNNSKYLLATNKDIGDN
jgi:hypothetical protein